MNDPIANKTPEPVESASAKSIQAYIDERPIWADGTAVGMTPMTAMQWRILSLAAAGKFFEGFVVFMTGVALPLIAVEYNISAAQHGLVSAASLAGILIGALFLGGLADRFGRKPMFIAEMFIFVAFLCLLVATPLFGINSFALLVFFTIRHRRRARLRLPDRAPDHLGKHPEHRSRPPGAGRVRVPGTRRADRHRGRLRDPQECP